MSNTKGQEEKRRPASDGPELRFGGVEFNLAPDAQDRLRRLFTILAAHFAEKDVAEKERDSPWQSSPEAGDEDAGQ